MCQTHFPFKDGVYHFDAQKDEKILAVKKAYDEIWQVGKDHWSDDGLGQETEIYDWAQIGCPFPIVVDAGCGVGRQLSHLLSMTSGLIINVDVSEAIYIAALKYTQLPNPKPQALFIKSPIENLPLANGVADLSWSSGVISVVPDQKRCLSEIFRITKGRVIIGFPSEQRLVGRIYLQSEIFRQAIQALKTPKVLIEWLCSLLGFFSALAMKIKSEHSFCCLWTTLKSTFFDILVAPTVKKLRNEIYAGWAQEKSFSLKQTKHNQVSEYLLFERNSH